MTEQDAVDYLIVGQGIAGTLLAHRLMEHGMLIRIIDQYRPYTSSRVAAGLFHPVTGRRLVKSWMVETLYKEAARFYQEQEKLLHSRFFFPKHVIEVIGSAREYNVWTGRLDDPGINQYLADAPPAGLYENKLKNFFRLIALSGSGWMDIARYLESSYQHFLKLNLVISGQFKADSFEINDDGIQYEDVKAQKIVFCEGSDAIHNPMWNWIPFLPSKGEILSIHAPDFPEDFIVLHGLFIIPVGNQRFRVGSTYSWNYEDETPSEAGKEEIIMKLNKIIDVPYRILDQKSAVRPTIQDRRPLLGKHPELKNTYIFNGLGTKGVLLGPYFANELARHLVYAEGLNPEADVRRFYPRH